MQLLLQSLKKRKGNLIHVTMWMNLEDIMLSKISQKQKDEWDFSGGTSGKEPTCQCRNHMRRHESEDSLRRVLATHSSILPWRILWTEDPGGLYSPWGRKESDMTERLSAHRKTNVA